MGRDRQEADLSAAPAPGEQARAERSPASGSGELALGALFVSFFAGIVAGEARIENDVFWHLAIGREIWTHGFPRVDPFSFTTGGVAWSPPEWLSELAMYGVHGAGGIVALSVVRLLLVLALGVLLWTRARTLGAPPFVALVVLAVASAPASVHLPLRPLLVGNVLLALVLDALERQRAGRRHLVVALPAIFVLWANLHPSWPVGLALVFLAWLAGFVSPRAGLRARLGLGGAPLPAREQRTLGLALLLSCASPLVRPDGLDGALYPFVHVVGLGDQASEIIEWFPLDWTEPLHVATVLGLALVLARLWVTRRERDGFALLAVLLTTLLVLRYQRFVPLATVVVAPIAAGLFGDAERRAALGAAEARGPRPALAPSTTMRALASLFTLAFLMNAMPRGGRLVGDMMGYPGGAVLHARAHPLPERTFNSFEDGGYLAWELERPVYIDSRFDLYARAGVFREYLRLRRGEDVLSIFDARGIDAALVPTEARDENFVAMRATLRDAGWEEVFTDDVAVVFVRPGAGAER